MFKFEIGSIVDFKESREFGEVRARAEFLDGENNYLIRYKNGQGCLVEAWWGESALHKYASLD